MVQIESSDEDDHSVLECRIPKGVEVVADFFEFAHLSVREKAERIRGDDVAEFALSYHLFVIVQHPNLDSESVRSMTEEHQLL